MKDTIVALATPAGVSALAVLRISGSAVVNICKAILPEFKMQPRIVNLTKCFGNSIIDNLLAIYFPAPNSYTGEDVLELFPHGNPFIIRKLLEEICKIEGVRLANKGEFTERAFLNGKIDLTQAEALGDILYASNSQTLTNSHRLLSGEISEDIKALAEKIKQVSAMLELEVDFAENIEIDNEHSGKTWLYLCNNILQHLNELKKRFKTSSNQLPSAALFGAPNAGKSSLINALVKQNRLLVSEIPGTTRDFVEVPLHLPGGDILLIDTAGLAVEAQNDIDRQAMQKTNEILKKSNLKILVIDISIPLPGEFEEWSKFADIIAGTHADLEAVVSGEWQMVSGPKNLGIKELRETLDNIFFPKTEEIEAAWITSERQIACIKKAEECVIRAQQSNAVELAAFEMREARNALCSITGEISDETVLNAIFSNYCIGK